MSEPDKPEFPLRDDVNLDALRPKKPAAVSLEDEEEWEKLKKTGDESLAEKIRRKILGQ